MSEKKIRITKAQRFEDIKALLNGETPTYGTTLEIAMEVLDHELELLAKKNSSGTGDKKLTETQQKNEEHKQRILEYLAGLPEDCEGVTCTEILKAIPELSEYQVQKVSALLSRLKLAGRVNSVKGKGGKTLFTLA